MKRTLWKVVLIASLLAAATVASFGQNAGISPSKRGLIDEMVSITKMEMLMHDSLRSVYGQMSDVYPQIIRETIDGDTRLTPAQKKTLSTDLAKFNIGVTQLQERLIKELDFGQIIETIYYPLYDKYFTEAELGDLIRFYKTPTGQKVISSWPAMMGESTRLTMEAVMPKIMEIVHKVAEEEVGKASKALPKSSSKN